MCTSKGWLLPQRFLLQAVFFSVLLLFNAIEAGWAEPKFDEALVPPGHTGRDILLLQGNWNRGGKDLLPARLFGTAKNKQEFDLEIVAEPGIVVKEPNKNPGKKFKVKADKDGKWELALHFDASQREDKPSTVSIALVSQADSTNTKALFHLGDCWLVMGSGNAAADISWSEFQERPKSLIVRERRSNGRLKITTVYPTSKPTSSPPGADSPTTVTLLATSFGFGLSERNKLRPVRVYTLAAPRSSLNDWWENGAFGELAREVFKDPVIPELRAGIAGVIWWQGEWEAETAETFDRDLFTSQTTSFARAAIERLDPERRKATPQERSPIQWMIMQAPTVGRLHPNLGDFELEWGEGIAREHRWAELRAAQFEAAMALDECADARIVPLISETAREAGPHGWVWDSSQQHELAARRILMTRAADDYTTSLVNAPPTHFSLKFPAPVQGPGTARLEGTFQVQNIPGGEWENWPAELRDNELRVPLTHKRIRYGWHDQVIGRVMTVGDNQTLPIAPFDLEVPQ